MKNLKKPLIFSLVMLPVAAIGGYFVAYYQFGMYDEATIQAIINQMGSLKKVAVIAVAQSVLYACGLGFFGYLLSEKLALMRPFRFGGKPLARTVLVSVLFGILFSLDYWTFGKWIPNLNIAATTAAGLSVAGWLGAIFYGGIIEEVMMRLFLMSFFAWVLWKLFFKKAETVPECVVIIANVLAALLFAAGHLPATVAFFGKLTPLIVFRCFLLNGFFGLFFGRLYRTYGIQYAMLAHALLHIVSKLVWTIFL